MNGTVGAKTLCGVLLLRKRRRGEDVLLVVRDGPHLGAAWDLPVGTADPEEPRPAAAARVLLETTGIAASLSLAPVFPCFAATGQRAVDHGTLDNRIFYAIARLGIVGVETETPPNAGHEWVPMVDAMSAPMDWWVHAHLAPLLSGVARRVW